MSENDKKNENDTLSFYTIVCIYICIYIKYFKIYKKVVKT